MRVAVNPLEKSGDKGFEPAGFHGKSFRLTIISPPQATANANR